MKKRRSISIRLLRLTEQILNLGSSTEELKNKIMELRWKPFNDFQDELDSDD